MAPLHRYAVAVSLGLALTSASVAQTTFTPPDFPALEKQKEMQRRRDMDDLEDQRDANRTAHALSPDANSAAQTALRDMQIRRDMDQLRLDLRTEQARDERERAITAAKLPNRRIAPTSVLAIREPERLGLPRPPEDRFYAKLDGRIVLVDKTSELVVDVLPESAAPPVLP